MSTIAPTAPETSVKSTPMKLRLRRFLGMVFISVVSALAFAHLHLFLPLALAGILAPLSAFLVMLAVGAVRFYVRQRKRGDGAVVMIGMSEKEKRQANEKIMFLLEVSLLASFAMAVSGLFLPFLTSLAVTPVAVIAVFFACGGRFKNLPSSVRYPKERTSTPDA